MEDVVNRNTFKKRVWNFLGSRNLSVFIFLMAITYSLLLIIFTLLVPPNWVDRISTLLPFKVLYLLFFINLIVCEIKWFPVVLKKCKKPLLPMTDEDLRRFKFRIKLEDDDLSSKYLKKYFRRKMYRVREIVARPQVPGDPSSDSSNHRTISPVLHAFKGRFSPLGNLLFHFSFVLLIAGVWMNLLYGFEGTTILMEGEEFMGARAEYASPPASRALPVLSFRVEKITPRYWADKLLFTDLRAELKYPDGGEVREGVASLSNPLGINGAQVALVGMGIAPRYVLREKNERVTKSAFIKLNIFSPGSKDDFKVPGYPYKVNVSFYPDHEVVDGRLVSRSMNADNPAYFINVLRNRVPVYIGNLKPGEEAYFEGLNLSFPEFKYWGLFRITKKEGHWLIWIAFIFFGIGLLWRLFFYQREIAVIKANGTIYLYGNSEYHSSLFKEELKFLLRPQSKS
ncbi:MAG: cytochrome c biogenesis protein ResB [Desulfobacteraceae bacterium]|nr:cytochrome c biogenesis protein ResB [Desulfobacteraceae bacterium]